MFTWHLNIHVSTFWVLYSIWFYPSHWIQGALPVHNFFFFFFLRVQTDRDVNKEKQLEAIFCWLVKTLDVFLVFFNHTCLLKISSNSFLLSLHQKVKHKCPRILFYCVPNFPGFETDSKFPWQYSSFTPNVHRMISPLPTLATWPPRCSTRCSRPKLPSPLHTAIRNAREDIVFLYLVEYDAQVCEQGLGLYDPGTYSESKKKKRNSDFSDIDNFFFSRMLLFFNANAQVPYTGRKKQQQSASKIVIFVTKNFFIFQNMDPCLSRKLKHY